MRQTEPELYEAVKKGVFALPTTPVLAPNQMRAYKLYYEQAAEKLNLVNTVMLESTQSAYQQAVSGIVSEMDIVERIGRTQTALDAAAGETITGVSAWNQAVKHATDRMKEGGITGFIDHGGHHWSAESYVAMDVRTTTFNTARAAVWETNENFGNDLYLVSSHSGARPLCYPWQNKVISSMNASREVPDLDGNPVHVYAQDETSYGQPAGLFGINCGHYPTPFIPGISTADNPVQDKEANDKAYAESQEQRRLERKLREEKRDLAMAKAQGASDEEIKKLREKARNTSQDIDDFCEQTGRARHRDREAVYTKREFPDQKKYDVSKFETEQKERLEEYWKTGGTQQGRKFQQMTPIATVNPAQAMQQTIPTQENGFVPSNTIDEAKRRAELDGVPYARFDGMTLERANNALEALETLPTDARPIAIANGHDISIMTDRPIGRHADQWYGVTYDYRLFGVRVMPLGYAPTEQGGVLVGLNTQKYKTLEQLTKAKESVNAAFRKKTGRSWFFNTDGRATAFHEMGHVYINFRGLPAGWEDIAARWAEESGCDMLRNPSEAFAEAYAAYYSNGRGLPDYVLDVMRGLK